MNRPTSNDPELDALLGAYALDALDDDERARVDAYLEVNVAARNEVDELRESAASLALAPVDDLSAPSELWDRISTSIAEEPRAFTPLIPRARRWTAVISVAAAAAIALLAAQVVVLQGRHSHTGDLAAAFNQAWTTKGARQVSLKAPNTGVEVARVVLLPDGRGYLKNENMQKLDRDQTYQLWALTGDPSAPTAISAGVIGDDPDAVAFHLAGAVNGFGVTIERAPGVVQTKQPMYASAAIT